MSGLKLVRFRVDTGTGNGLTGSEMSFETQPHEASVRDDGSSLQIFGDGFRTRVAKLQEIFAVPTHKDFNKSFVVLKNTAIRVTFYVPENYVVYL